MLGNCAARIASAACSYWDPARFPAVVQQAFYRPSILEARPALARQAWASGVITVLLATLCIGGNGCYPPQAGRGEGSSYNWLGVRLACPRHQAIKGLSVGFRWCVKTLAQPQRRTMLRESFQGLIFQQDSEK